MKASTYSMEIEAEWYHVYGGQMVNNTCMGAKCVHHGVHHCERDSVLSKLRCAFQPFLKTGPQKPNKLDLFIYVKNVPRKIEPGMFFTGKIGFG